MNSSKPTTTIVSADEVRAAIGSGGAWVTDRDYRVSVARRDVAGEVEIHETETDVFYVLAGVATLTTGGETRDTRTVAPHEIRGSAIDGGDTRAVSKGDVIVIPRTVPHWFCEVTEAPFVYLVVKVTHH